MEYDGTSITPFTRIVGIEAPLVHWEPSIAPSGLLFYTGREFPKWQGHLLLGTLATEQLLLLTLEKGEITRQEIIFSRIGRIRQVTQDAEGRIYLLLPHAVVRLTNPDRAAQSP
jgi:glucose/arabinose dehydrogenase